MALQNAPVFDQSGSNDAPLFFDQKEIHEVQVVVKRYKGTLLLTKLAAGFIIGPGGKSIREIERRCGVEIKSQLFCGTNRLFDIEGPVPNTVVAAKALIQNALNQFKQLEKDGYHVATSITVAGVNFWYQPRAQPPVATPYPQSAPREYSVNDATSIPNSLDHLVTLLHHLRNSRQKDAPWLTDSFEQQLATNSSFTA